MHSSFGRHKANTWPCPSDRDYEAVPRTIAADRLTPRGYPAHSPYILAALAHRWRNTVVPRTATRTSWMRSVPHSLGLKAPYGWGWLTNPRRVAHNRVCRSTIGCFGLLALALAIGVALPGATL